MNKQGGLTMLEVLLVVALAGILITGVTVLLGRAFSISRENIEQSRITDIALSETGRISEAIENIRSVNGDGGIVQLTDYDMTMYTNVDGDDDPEKVRYYLADVPDENWDVLTREVTELVESGGFYEEGEVGTSELTQYVRNRENGEPLFKLDLDGGLGGGGGVFGPKAPSITLTVLIDIVENRYPDVATVKRDPVVPQLELIQAKLQEGGVATADDSGDGLVQGAMMSRESGGEVLAATNPYDYYYQYYGGACPMIVNYSDEFSQCVQQIFYQPPCTYAGNEAGEVYHFDDSDNASVAGTNTWLLDGSPDGAGVTAMSNYGGSLYIAVDGPKVYRMERVNKFVLVGDEGDFQVGGAEPLKINSLVTHRPLQGGTSMYASTEGLTAGSGRMFRFAGDGDWTDLGSPHLSVAGPDPLAISVVVARANTSLLIHTAATFLDLNINDKRGEVFWYHTGFSGPSSWIHVNHVEVGQYLTAIAYHSDQTDHVGGGGVREGENVPNEWHGHDFWFVATEGAPIDGAVNSLVTYWGDLFAATSRGVYRATPGVDGTEWFEAPGDRPNEFEFGNAKWLELCDEDGDLCVGGEKEGAGRVWSRGAYRGWEAMGTNNGFVSSSTVTTIAMSTCPLPGVN